MAGHGVTRHGIAGLGMARRDLARHDRVRYSPYQGQTWYGRGGAIGSTSATRLGVARLDTTVHGLARLGSARRGREVQPGSGSDLSRARRDRTPISAARGMTRRDAA